MYANEIFFNYRLKKIIATDSGKATQLKFESKTVNLTENDLVILALDNYNCQKLIKVPSLKHCPIINIEYQTSQTIFLPRGVSFLGIINGTADWIYSKDNLLTAVVIDYLPRPEKLPEMARKIWLELDKIRNVNSAFIPPYKILCYKNAVVSPDEQNEKNKPETAKTEYSNVFVAGDWTMKKEPCRLETAIKSAKRAVREALKYK